MTVLLTGAAGFIGSHLAERTLRRAETVVGLDDFNDFYDRGVKKRNLEAARDWEGLTLFTLVRDDIRDRECLQSLPDHVDAVLHVAAWAGVRPSIRPPALYHARRADFHVWFRQKRM